MWTSHMHRIFSPCRRRSCSNKSQGSLCLRPSSTAGFQGVLCHSCHQVQGTLPRDWPTLKARVARVITRKVGGTKIRSVVLRPRYRRNVEGGGEGGTPCYTLGSGCIFPRSVLTFYIDRVPEQLPDTLFAPC